MRGMHRMIESLDRLPPYVCRLIARTKGRPLTTPEISERSGIPVRRVAYISKQRSWLDIPVREVVAFRAACGVTESNTFRHIEYLKRTRFAKKPLRHLDKLPRWQKAKLAFKS